MAVLAWQSAHEERVEVLKKTRMIMEKKMKSTIAFWGLSWDNGKENGNY